MFSCIRVIEAIHLGSVEDGEAARGAPRAVVARIVRIGLGLKGFVENDRRSGFALADLRAEFAPLFIGGPMPRGIAGFLGRNPEHDSVDAAIGAFAGGVERKLEALAAPAPGHSPVAGVALDRSDQAAGDKGVNVFWLRACAAERGSVHGNLRS